MLSDKEALLIIEKNLPKSIVKKYIEYKNLFVFQVFIDDPNEGGFDPYYSVNKDTKEFRDFSIITDGDITELMSLFEKSKEVRHMDSIDDILQHAGVKGMKWGVVRSKSAKAAAKAGKVASSGAKKVANSRVGKEVGSVKREMQWNKVLKDVSNMTTAEIGKKATRLQQENEIKRMSANKDGVSLNPKDRKAASDRRKIYLDRGKMSDSELSSAVTRMRVEDNLKRNVESANSMQKKIGKKIVSTAAPLALKYALGEKIELKDVQAAFQNNKDAKVELRNQVAASAGKKVVEAMAKRAGA